MVDIAELGFKADTSDLSRANKELKKLPASAAGAEKGADKTTGALKRLAAGGALANKGLRGVAAGAGFLKGKLFQLAAGVATLAAFKAVIAGARKFQAALVELSTLLPVGSANLVEMQAAARAMADEFGTNAAFQIKAFYGAVSAGAVDAAAAIGIVDTANRLAIGGITDVATGVDVLTTATNAYSASGQTAVDTSDTLFVGMKAGKTTIGELASGLGNVIPIAAALDVEFTQLVAGVSALTLQGLSTSTAITSLRAILSGIAKPTSEAKKLAKELGIEFSTTALQSKGLSGFLQDIVTKTDGSATKLSLLFGSVEALNAALAFAGEGGTAFNEILGQMEERSGATNEAFDKVASGLDARMTKALSEIWNVMVDFGNLLLQVVVPALEAVAFGVKAVAFGVKIAWDAIKGFMGFLSKMGSHFVDAFRPLDQYQTAVDNVTIALGDQLTQIQLLNVKMNEGRILTQAGAQAELNIARARHTDIQAMIAKRRETVLSSAAYTTLLDRMSSVRDIIPRLTGSDKLADALEEQELSLARMLVTQQEMLNSTNQNADAFEENLKVIDRLERAIAKSSGGLVTFGAALVAPIDLSARLEGNFAGIAAQARQIMTALNQAPAALQGLEQQGQVIQAEINALTSGMDTAAASAAAYRKEREQYYHISAAGSMAEAAALANIIDGETAQFENNLRNQEILNNMRNPDGGASSAATALTDLQQIASGFGSLSEPFQQATAAYAAADTAFRNGIITNDEFVNSLARIRDGFITAGGSAEQWAVMTGGQIETISDKMEALTERGIGGMLDGFVDLALTGKANFADLARSIISDMIKMALKALILKPLMGMFGFKSGGSFGDDIDPLPNAHGNAFSSEIIPFKRGGDFTNSVVTQSTPFSFAQGTALGEMGEAGPEAIMPLQRGPNGDLGVQMFGGSGQKTQKPTVSINNHYTIEGAVSEEKITAAIRSTAEQTTQDVKQSLVGWLGEQEQNGVL